MRTIRSIRAMAGASSEAGKRGPRIGFVPTMGYMHEGHLRLIDKAAAETDLVIVSVFVNPLQFGRGEDFGRYPRDLKRDRALAEKRGCDILFVPDHSAFYPPGFRTSVRVKDLEGKLCGGTRPGHFAGVCTVVAKLLNIVRPNRLYLGRKDAQQAIILKRMIEDLEMGVTVRVCPIVREPDGLAMSSRNVYLTDEQRRQAPSLYLALRAGAETVRGGEREPARVRDAMLGVMRESPEAEVEYLEVVDPSTLDTPSKLRGRVLLAGAVRFGRTRLIDNVTATAG